MTNSALSQAVRSVGTGHGPRWTRSEPSERLFNINHNGGTVMIDSPNVLVVALTLSNTHNVALSANGRTHSGSPGVGYSTLIAPGTPTRVVTRGACRLIHLRLLWSDLTNWLAEDFEVDPARVEMQSCFQADDPVLARSIYRAMTAPRDGYDGEGGLRFVARMLLTRYTSHPATPKWRRATKRGGLPPAKMRRLMDLIEADPCRSPTIAAMAAEVNLSPFHFAREFERTLGEPPHRFMLRHRVRHAIGLLGDRSLTIGEVASLTGFSHASHLARHMRTVTSYTPESFRKYLLW